MRILTETRWRPAEVDQNFRLAAQYELLAAAAGELAAVDYGMRHQATDVSDPSVRTALRTAWDSTDRLSADGTTRPSSELRSAWLMVAELAFSHSLKDICDHALLMAARSGGRLQAQSGGIENQLAVMRDSLQLSSSLPNDRWPFLMIALARLSIALGDTEQAMITITKILDRTSQSDVIGDCHLMLADISAGDESEARRELALALESFDGYAQGIAEAHWGLACLAEQSGDLEKAVREYISGASAYESANDLLGQSEFVSDATLHFIRAGQLPLAEEWSRRALELHHKTNNWIEELRHYSWLCSLAGVRDDFQEVARLTVSAAALKVLLRRLAWSDEDRQSLISMTQHMDYHGVRASIIAKMPWETVTLLEARRADSIALMMRRELSTEELPPRLVAALENVEALERQSGHVNVSVSSLVSQSEIEWKLNASYKELEREIGFAAADARAPGLLNLRDVTASLPQWFHLLQYELFTDPSDFDERIGGDLVVTWIPGSSNEPIVRLHRLTRGEVETLDLLTRGLKPVFGTEAEGASWPKWLADLLLPVELSSMLGSAANPSGELPFLMISPTGKLWGLPFAAVRVGKGYLVEQAVLAFTPSFRTCFPANHQALVPNVSSPEPPQSKLKALCHLYGVGGLDIERSALALAYDLKEVGARELLFELGRDHHFDVAVISSHGGRNAGLSHGLFLGDGEILTAASMLRMKIPDILVMGSCWSTSLSHTGEAEPLGLPTAALLRGSRAVIGGIYPLPDGPHQPTAELLAAFHRELARGHSAPEALRLAQIALMKPRDTGDWRNWAGVICLTRLAPKETIPINVAHHVGDKPLPREPTSSLANRRRGVVKWFDSTNGFGFIAQVGGGPDVFVHFSQINVDGDRSLVAGQQVEFGITEGRKGPSAIRVTLVDY
jgi:cold shock CspA family protein/tetratricopeptide (TPR) repeat protein